ncbi:hypothetical protein RvY_01002 [Ramazzottius varieornatus]|uniref:Uncharacterized protein n=1 Tax=Ramazzottius varieornatus TaxID=947166 RepID=A0A1D1UES0_RAMVA|nr:hypothetical protein RvY_01002 [Ramazzottius varieornatus]
MAGYSETREINREDPTRFFTLSSHDQKGFDDDNNFSQNRRRIGMSDDQILSGNDIHSWYRHLTGDQPPITLRDFSSFFDRHPGSTWHRDQDGTLVIRESSTNSFSGRPEEKQIDYYNFRPWANQREDRQPYFDYQPQQDFHRFDREQWGGRDTGLNFGYNTFSNYQQDFPNLQESEFLTRRQYENEGRDRQFGGQNQSAFSRFSQERWGDMDSGLRFRQDAFPGLTNYNTSGFQQEAQGGGLLNEIRNFDSGTLRHVSRDDQFNRDQWVNRDTGFQSNNRTDFTQPQHHTANANLEFHPELMNEIKNFSWRSLRHVARDDRDGQQRSNYRDAGFQFRQNTFDFQQEFPRYGQDQHFNTQQNFSTHFQRGDVDRDRHYEYVRQQDQPQNTFTNFQEAAPQNYYDTYTPFRFGRNDQFDYRDTVSRQQFQSGNDYGRYGNMDNNHRFDRQPEQPSSNYGMEHQFDTQRFSMDRQPFYPTFQPEQRNYSYGTEHTSQLKRLHHDEPLGGRRQPFGQHFERRPHFGHRQRQQRSRPPSQGDQWMHTDLDKIDTHLFDDEGRERQNRRGFQSEQNTFFDQRYSQPRYNQEHQGNYGSNFHSGENIFNSLQGFSGPQHDHFIGRHFEYQGQPNSQQYGRNDWDNPHTGFRFQQDMAQRNDQRFGPDQMTHQFDTQRFNMDRQPFQESWTRHFQPQQRMSDTIEHPIPFTRLQHDEQMGYQGPSFFAGGQNFNQCQQYGGDHQRHAGRHRRQQHGRARAQREQWVHTDLDKIDTHLFDLDLGHHERQQFGRGNQSHQNTFSGQWGYPQQHRDDFFNNQPQHMTNYQTGNRDRHFDQRQTHFQQGTQQGWDDRHFGFQTGQAMVDQRDWMNQQSFRGQQQDQHFGGRQQHRPAFFGGQHFEHGRQYGVDHERHIKRRLRQERNRKREQEEQWVHTDLDKIDTHLFELDLGRHEGQYGMNRNQHGGQRYQNEYYRGQDFYQGQGQGRYSQHSSGGLRGGFERYQTGGHGGNWGRHNDAYRKKVNDLGGLGQIINALATDVQHVVPQ